MNAGRAKKVAKELQGKSIAGWTAGRLLGFGKSALVLRGDQGDQKAALKLFDPEVVEAGAPNEQRERIERQRNLIGVSHPHLVEILNAGWSDEVEMFFVVMPLLPADTVESLLPQIPREQIAALIAQVASAARFL